MYEIIIEKNGERDLKKLKKNVKNVFERVVEKIIHLKENPKPSGVRKIVGSESDWRLRVGEYRIIYELDEQQKLIKIFRIKHRKDVYRF